MYQRRVDTPHRSIQHEDFERACPFYGAKTKATIEDAERNMETLIRKNTIGYGGGFDITDPVTEPNMREEVIYFATKVLTHA